MPAERGPRRAVKEQNISLHLGRCWPARGVAEACEGSYRALPGIRPRLASWRLSASVCDAEPDYAVGSMIDRPCMYLSQRTGVVAWRVSRTSSYPFPTGHPLVSGSRSETLSRRWRPFEGDDTRSPVATAQKGPLASKETRRCGRRREGEGEEKKRKRREERRAGHDKAPRDTINQIK